MKLLFTALLIFIGFLLGVATAHIDHRFFVNHPRISVGTVADEHFLVSCECPMVECPGKP